MGRCCVAPTPPSTAPQTKWAINPPIGAITPMFIAKNPDGILAADGFIMGNIGMMITIITSHESRPHSTPLQPRRTG